jgi:hypothetical protein
MDLFISPTGQVRCLYDESIDLAVLGSPVITRASHVEPTAGGCWNADLSPVAGPLLGPFARRTDALHAEHAWLTSRWL